MLVVPFVLLVVAILILAGVVAAAMGRGGELTLFYRDLPEQRFLLRSAADVAMLRLSGTGDIRRTARYNRLAR
jgi:hypothetical protein